MSFCVSCGAEVFSGSVKCIKCSLGIAPPVSREQSKPARRRLFVHPITKDWTFWLFLVFAVLGGVQTNYRQGSMNSTGNSAGGVGAALIDVVFLTSLSLALTFLFCATLPAFIRKLFYLSGDRRALGIHPPTDSGGWHQDPLDSRRQRWWNGQIWTQATLPGMRLFNTGSKLLASVIVLALFVAFGVGIASNSSKNSTNSSNATMMVNVAFQDLAEAAQKFNSIQINPNDPLGNISEVRDAYLDIEMNYTLLKGALGSVTSQLELGTGAPSLESLNAMISAMGPYVQIRSDYFAALEQCSPIVSGRDVTDCDLDVYADYERSLINSIAPVATTWEAVFESIPKS